MAEVRHVTGNDFDEVVLGSELPVLVDFWAGWCGPCRMLAPIVEELAGDYADRLRVVKVNVDEAADLAERYGISSVPVLNIYRDGEVVKSIVGARPKQVLMQEMEAVL